VSRPSDREAVDVVAGAAEERVVALPPSNNRCRSPKRRVAAVMVSSPLPPERCRSLPADQRVVAFLPGHQSLPKPPSMTSLSARRQVVVAARPAMCRGRHCEDAIVERADR
jgi:hypothetical protein